MSEPNAESTLDREDARQIVRLLGEVCAMQSGHAEMKRHLMDGLCRIIGADCWAWALAAHLRPGDLPIYVGIQNGGFSEAELAKFLTIQAHPQMALYTEPLIFAVNTAGSQVSRNVHSLFDYEEFLASEVGRMWTEAGFHPRCVTFRPAAEGGFTGIGIYRRLGGALFTDREARIIHIVLSEVPWLHELGWPEDRAVKVPDLSPRCWLVHEMLLQGFSRQQIAGHLDLSMHTVSGYVKTIYQHFGVRSHAELFARFYRGDGGHSV